MIVPWAPGGTTDILGRVIAQKMGEKWGQPVLVENRGGAAGNIGTEAAARSPADGYTLVLGTMSSHAMNQFLYEKMTFDPVADLAPISNVAESAAPREWPPSTTGRVAPHDTRTPVARRHTSICPLSVNAIRHGNRTSATGHPASATARTKGKYASGSTAPPGMNSRPVRSGVALAGMKIVAPSRSDTNTVADDVRTPAGTPCACMFHTTHTVNATPAAAHAILNRRRSNFQFTPDFAEVVLLWQSRQRIAAPARRK